MAEVDTSIYKNQPNPLGSAQGVMNLLNTSAQNQLLQTATQQRQFDLYKGQNDAVNALIGPLQTIPGLDAKGAQSIILPQMRAMGLDPARSPVAAQHLAPLLSGELDDPKKFKAWIAGHSAPFLGAGGFAPVSGPTAGGAPANILPGQRATIPGAVATGPTPEEEAAQRGETTAGVAEKSADLSAAGDWQNKKLTQSKIIELLHKGGDKLQGLTTDETTALKNVAASYGIIEPNAASAVEQLRKYYQRNIESNSKATTDYSRAGAVIGNPNIKLTDASAKQLAMMDTIMARLRQAQSQEMIPVKSRDFISARAKFNQSQDLYAYGMDMLGPQAQREHINSLFPANAGIAKMNDTQYRAFLKNADTAASKDGTPLYPKWQKFRNSLGIAHKYEQMDLPQVSD